MSAEQGAVDLRRVEEWARADGPGAARLLARNDPAFFLNTFCTALDLTRNTAFEFHERPIQARLRELVLSEHLVVGVKARGVGWTWEIALLMLWEAWAKAPYEALYFCQREENAWKFIKRIRWAAQRLPSWLGFPREADEVKHRFGFVTAEGEESEILAFPSTPSAVQFHHSSRIVCDEWGLIPDDVLPSVLPAVGTDGYFLGMGTSEGLGTEHSKVYVSCRDGKPELYAHEGMRFAHIFASWKDDPSNCWVVCPDCELEEKTERIRLEPEAPSVCPRCRQSNLRQEWRRPTGGSRKDTERMYPENDRECFPLTAPGEPVYPEFDASIHVSPVPLRAEPGLPLIRAWDFGYNRPACVVFQMSPLGQCRILREFLGREVGVKTFARATLEGCHLVWPPTVWRWVDWGDPSVNQRRDTDGRSCQKIMREDFGLRLKPGLAQWTPRREAVADLLSRLVNGKPALIVDARCRYLIEGFQGMYHFPKGRESIEGRVIQDFRQQMASRQRELQEAR